MRSFVGNLANTGEVANYFVTIVYLYIGYANMLKSIQRVELTLSDFVYTFLYSISIIFFCNLSLSNMLQQVYKKCRKLWKYVDNCSSSVRFTKCLYKESMHKKIPWTRIEWSSQKPSFSWNSTCTLN